jgi:hypothetical protein
MQKSKFQFGRKRGLGLLGPQVLVALIPLVSFYPSLYAQSSPSTYLAQGRTKKTPPKNVSALFREGKKAFDEGEFAQASGIFHRLLKIQPNHQPTLLLYARASYKLERIDEAYYLFTRVNPQLLDGDAAYEYAHTFFQKQQFGPALAAFRKVPEKHALGDLARYYGGVSAAKLRQYDEAEDLMKRAVVLPEREAKTRALYLKHIARLKELQAKKALASERALERERMKIELQLAERAAEIDALTVKARGQQSPAETAPYRHQGFQEVLKAVNAGVRGKIQTVDYSGLNTERFDLRQIFLQVQGGALLPFGSEGSSGRSAIGLQLSGIGMEELRDGREVRTFVEPEVSDVVRVLSPSPAHRIQAVGELDSRLWLEIPFNHGIWLGVLGDFYIRAPRFVREERTGSRSGAIQLGQKTGKWALSGKTSYQQIFDRNTDVVHDIIGAAANASYEFTPDTRVLAELSYNNFEYFGSYRDSLDGPSNIYRLNSVFTHNMPLGFFIEGHAIGDYQTTFLAYNVVNYSQPVSADGFVATGKVVLGTSPWPWLFASVYGMVQKSLWQTVDPDAQESFNRKVSDYLDESGATISVNLFF